MPWEHVVPVRLRVSRPFCSSIFDIKISFTRGWPIGQAQVFHTCQTSSILAPRSIFGGRNSAAECNLARVDAMGSSPIARSRLRRCRRRHASLVRKRARFKSAAKLQSLLGKHWRRCAGLVSQISGFDSDTQLRTLSVEGGAQLW